MEPAFKPRTAMNFNGATATSNLMFADDESCTISTHSIKVIARDLRCECCLFIYMRTPD